MWICSLLFLHCMMLIPCRISLLLFLHCMWLTICRNLLLLSFITIGSLLVESYHFCCYAMCDAYISKSFLCFFTCGLHFVNQYLAVFKSHVAHTLRKNFPAQSVFDLQMQYPQREREGVKQKNPEKYQWTMKDNMYPKIISMWRFWQTFTSKLYNVVHDKVSFSWICFKSMVKISR